MCVKRYVLSVSLTYKAKLKRMLIRYLVKTFIKSGRHQPIRLSNKGGKYLTPNGLNIRPPY